MLIRKPLYFVVSLEKPTVGATKSMDSPTKDLAVHVFPVLSSPNISTQIFRSKMLTDVRLKKWLQHMGASATICIIVDSWCVD